jgi:hypothetical protein
MRRDGKLSNETINRILRELDLEESRLETREDIPGTVTRWLLQGVEADRRARQHPAQTPTG